MSAGYSAPLEQAPPRRPAGPLVMGLGATLGFVDSQGIVAAVTGLARKPSQDAHPDSWLRAGTDYRHAFSRGPHSRSVTLRIVESLSLLISGEMEWVDDYLGTESYGWIHFQATRMEVPDSQGAVFAYERLPRRESPPMARQGAVEPVRESHPEMFSRLTTIAVDVLRSRCLKSINGIIQAIDHITSTPHQGDDQQFVLLRAQAQRLGRDLPTMAQLLDLIDGYAERISHHASPDLHVDRSDREPN